MDMIIPHAIGYGLDERDTWNMTPAEILTFVNSRRKHERNLLSAFDTMNAMIIANIRASQGEKGVKPSDYLVIPKDEEKEESEVPVKGDSPDTIMMKLNLLTAGMGGKPKWG